MFWLHVIGIQTSDVLFKLSRFHYRNRPSKAFVHRVGSHFLLQLPRLLTPQPVTTRKSRFDRLARLQDPVRKYFFSLPEVVDPASEVLSAPDSAKRTKLPAKIAIVEVLKDPQNVIVRLCTDDPLWTSEPCCVKQRLNTFGRPNGQVAEQWCRNLENNLSEACRWDCGE